MITDLKFFIYRKWQIVWWSSYLSQHSIRMDRHRSSLTINSLNWMGIWCHTCEGWVLAWLFWWKQWGHTIVKNVLLLFAFSRQSIELFCSYFLRDCWYLVDTLIGDFLSICSFSKAFIRLISLLFSFSCRSSDDTQRGQRLKKRRENADGKLNTGRRTSFSIYQYEKFQDVLRQ